MKNFIIEIKSVDKKTLTIYKKFFLKILIKLDICFNIINLPNKKKIITLLKSPHVNKKAREQFEHRIYKKRFLIKSNVNLKLLKVLTLIKPKNIKIKIISCQKKKKEYLWMKVCFMK